METRLERLEITVDGQPVAATLLAPATVTPGVLFVHGWGGSQAQDLARAREAAGLGCVCLTFDLRGHELTSSLRETVTREENLRDLVAAYDLLVAHPGVDPDAIAVVGISYGGYLATVLSTLRPVRWLALRAPAIYKDAGWELAKRQLNLDPELATYRRSGVEWCANRALQASAAFRGDVLIVESEHDAIVPHQVIANYIAAFTKVKSITSRVIAGADHGLEDKKCQRAYTSLLINWLTEMVIGARSHRQADAAPERELRQTATLR